MKPFQELLIELKACNEAQEWAQGKTIKQVVAECHRGDWLLWLAEKVDMDFQTITLAKGLCANTVRHLMKDDRSIKAVDVAIAFGRDEATLDELDSAYAAAAAARQQNQQQTANICREVFGSKLIELVINKLL
jgi:hypothetical protein